MMWTMQARMVEWSNSIRRLRNRVRQRNQFLKKKFGGSGWGQVKAFENPLGKQNLILSSF